MTTNRVHYREGQVLGRQDLQDEQDYLIAMRRRHTRIQHGWGIVQGLSLEPDTVNKLFKVKPGFAIDRYGRELVVPQELVLDQRVFTEMLGAPNAEGCLDVWITYGLRETNVVPEGQASRVAEEAWLKLQVVDDQNNLPEAFNTDVPLDPAPDDPTLESPVYLGRALIPKQTIGGQTAVVYSVLMENQRQYVNVAGASLKAPWGEGWMQIGEDEARDNRCFAISLAGEDGLPVDRMVLDRNGDALLRGKLGIKKCKQKLDGDGNLVFAGSSADTLSEKSGLLLEALKSAPAQSAPRQIYATRLEKPVPAEQLRFELYHPGKDGDPSLSQWAVGNNDGQGFNPFLTVLADGTVIVTHDLEIGGQLIEGEIPLDFEDPRFRDQLLKRWSQGLTVAGAEVDALYELPLTITLEIVSNQNGIVKFKVKLTNSDTKYDIPVLTLIAEFRDADIRLILSKDLKPELNKHNYRVAIGQSIEVTDEQILHTSGATKLTVRVVALGSAQNTVEKTVSTVIELT